MPPKIEYKASVAKDLRRLSREAAKRILGRLEKSLTEGHSRGERLSGEFAGLYRIRVGDYRVIYAKGHEGFLVLTVAHRRDVYRRPLLRKT